MESEMIKKCWVLDGQIINIGDWDYQKTVGLDGKEVIGNPLPKGAVMEERNFEQSPDGGWYLDGKVPKTEVELLREDVQVTQMALLDLVEELTRTRSDLATTQEELVTTQTALFEMSVVSAEGNGS